MTNDQSLHNAELAFFSRVTASISHELNNVLSIINEYSGLLNDLALASTKDKPLEAQRIKEITINIAEQIKREQQIIKLLNRFAHRLDTPLIKFNMNDLIQDIIRLSQRFASQKKVTININYPEEPILIINNPFRIQFIVFLCLRLAMENSNSNDDITGKFKKESTQCEFIISSRSGIKEDETQKTMELISSLVKIVGGDISSELTSEKSTLINIRIPLLLPEDIGGQ